VSGADLAGRPDADEPRPRDAASRLAAAASVVGVTKDRPRELARLLASLARQTVRAGEVIVVDNGSGPEVAAAAAAFRDALPLRMVAEPARGIPAARNRGIREARGDLVLFIDDDCEADPDWVERLVRPFARDPHIGAVGGEILSGDPGRGLVEAFCADETLLRMGRDGAS
jgi:glycosyltransferase involved in cell wall biosynthesis